MVEIVSRVLIILKTLIEVFIIWICLRSAKHETQPLIFMVTLDIWWIQQVWQQTARAHQSLGLWWVLSSDYRDCFS